MAVQVPCPACRAGVMVYNANYLVFLNCHACGHEFMADVERLPAIPEASSTLPVEPADSLDQAESWPAEVDESVLMFCPMCGELASESAPTCTACGEALPVDGPWNEYGWDHTSRHARRFRRHARWLGILWILLAYVLSAQDYWVGGTELALPPMILGGELAIPKLPLMTTILVGLGAFAIVGQFWAVAVGGLLNYLILFVVVWRANVASLCVLAVSIVLTHIVLHQASSARFR